MDFELKNQLTIALDAMGGDEAPQMVIEGVNLARVKFPNVRFLLFGDEDKIYPLLNKNEELKNANHTSKNAHIVELKNAKIYAFFISNAFVSPRRGVAYL